jgi:hypothetical protein
VPFKGLVTSRNLLPATNIGTELLRVDASRPQIKESVHSVLCLSSHNSHSDLTGRRISLTLSIPKQT